jgi:creatinine amidohydrolase
MPVLKLDELCYTAVDQLDRATTLALLTVSPLEEHGPHLPLGVDLLDAEYFCDELARRFTAERPEWTVLRAPPVPLGTWTFDAAGSINTRASAMRDLVYDYGASLARHGFRYLVVLSGHGAIGHLVALEEAAAAVERRYGMKMVSLSSRMIPEILGGSYLERIEQHLGRPLSGEERRMMAGDTHAGLLETSLMLKLRPEQVGAHRHLHAYDPRGLERLMPQYAMRFGRQGYVGYPAAASEEFGAAALAALLEASYEKLLQAIANPERERRRITARLPFLRVDYQRYATWGLAIGAALGLGWWWGRRK